MKKQVAWIIFWGIIGLLIIKTSLWIQVPEHIVLAVRNIAIAAWAITIILGVYLKNKKAKIK